MTTELNYLSYIIQCIEKEAQAKRLGLTDDFVLDWGELQLLLTHAKKGKLLAFNQDETYNCSLCGVETPLVREEQYIVKPDSNVIEAKCLHCLIDTLKEDQSELQQITALHWFLKENNLEEEFDLFCLENQQHTNG